MPSPTPSRIGRRKVLATMAAAGAATTLLDRTPAIASPVSAGPVVTLGTKNILVPKTSTLHQYPYSFAWDKEVGGVTVRMVRVGINKSPDDPAAPTSTLFMYSTDAGTTWTEHTPAGGVPRFEMPGGALINFGFTTTFAPDDQHIQINWSQSTDSGDTFTSGSSVLTSTIAFQENSVVSGRAQLSLQDRPHLGADGSIRQPAYGRYSGDTVGRSFLLTTPGVGQPWSVRSTIAYDANLLPGVTGYEGLVEPTVVKTSSGDLLAVMRTGSSPGATTPIRPLHVCRSTDDGLTWTAPTPLLTGSTSVAVNGVNPKLRQLPNGVLLLLTGRDLVRVYISADGTGASWSDAVVVSDMGYESGNCGFDVIDDDTAIVIGDRRSNLRPPSAPSYQYEIWSRTVTVTV